MFKGPQEIPLAGNAAAASAAATSAAAVAVVRCINLIIWSNFHNFGQISIILVKLPQFWSNFLNFGQISKILVKFPLFWSNLINFLISLILAKLTEFW